MRSNEDGKSGWERRTHQPQQLCGSEEAEDGLSPKHKELLLVTARPFTAGGAKDQKQTMPGTNVHKLHKVVNVDNLWYQ